jgi:hypothetical protein
MTTTRFEMGGPGRRDDRLPLGFGRNLCPHRPPRVDGADSARHAGEGRRCACGRPRLVIEFTPHPGLTTHLD